MEPSLTSSCSFFLISSKRSIEKSSDFNKKELENFINDQNGNTLFSYWSRLTTVQCKPPTCCYFVQLASQKCIDCTFLTFAIKTSFKLPLALLPPYFCSLQQSRYYIDAQVCFLPLHRALHRFQFNRTVNQFQVQSEKFRKY